ncbi:MAG: glycoside hydrolase family 2, candidate beta-glycosidase [Bacteroidetes bacterium]|nr:glycoside hydrolase family 2, candidate beta-glycosidase [Bacteroidota bacterium]
MNGTWEVSPGDPDSPPSRWTSRVDVPSLVDTAIPSYAWRDSGYHWYRTRFVLPPAQRPECVFLVLEQSMFGTEVRLNGVSVGRDIACYTSQEYDVTSEVRYGKVNELLVRVGSRDTLPPESAVGNDQERDTTIPGIWGDAWVLRTGIPRIRRVQVIPRPHAGAAQVRVFLHNPGDQPRDLRCRCRVVGEGVRLATSAPAAAGGFIAPGTETVMTLRVDIPEPRLWSPDDPFLYTLETEVESAGTVQDRLSTPFGMREFRVEGGDFTLNGRKILLRGGNIAFHRFLSDAARGTLPWDLDWAKRLLIDLPKAHHFNVFRAHLGQMYNRWYDIADRHGMLLQNEWPFWTRSGSEDQIRHEFTRWLEDNWNHPSIILWDPMNESHDEFVAGELVSEMKELDPTRAWEMRDFVDEHPYIYSLGPVLTDTRFGFSRLLQDIEQSAAPSVVNEFLWWWLDPDNNPTLLTRDVLERWMGPEPDRDQIIAHQSFLAREQIELFRRMKVDAIQPFVYLSNGQGPTGHWFLGDVRDLVPKPVLAAIGEAFSPFGVSVELWDRHFFPGERRHVRIFVFNDRDRPETGVLRWGIADVDGAWVGPEGGSAPAELHVVEPPGVSESLRRMVPGVLEESGEIMRYLHDAGIGARDLATSRCSECDVILVADGLARGNTFRRHGSDLDAYLASGRTLVLIEPECGVATDASVPVAAGVTFDITRRPDTDRGGYDSFVFMEDPGHKLWQGIPEDHLKFFNGGFGGEIVSQHDIRCTMPMSVLARCGLKLATVAVAEVSAGGGTIVLSRLQMRGRLTGSREADALYGRRADPVARRYLLNLLESYGRRRATS